MKPLDALERVLRLIEAEGLEIYPSRWTQVDKLLHYTLILGLVSESRQRFRSGGFPL